MWRFLHAFCWHCCCAGAFQTCYELGDFVLGAFWMCRKTADAELSGRRPACMLSIIGWVGSCCSRWFLCRPNHTLYHWIAFDARGVMKWGSRGCQSPWYVGLAFDSRIWVWTPRWRKTVVWGLKPEDVRLISLNELTAACSEVARIVCQASRRQHHSAYLLKDLHWLPVRGRVDYKIAVLCYKAVKLQQPSYLTCLLPPYRQSRVLRSSTSDLLSTQSSLTNIAARRFSCCASTVWNSLPSFCLLYTSDAADE